MKGEQEAQSPSDDDTSVSGLNLPAMQTYSPHAIRLEAWTKSHRSTISVQGQSASERVAVTESIIPPSKDTARWTRSDVGLDLQVVGVNRSVLVEAEQTAERKV